MMVRCRKAQGGFTLIEVIIVVAILGILTAIAVPTYRGSTLRSGRAEGQSELMAAARSMEQVFSRLGSYNSATISAAPGATIALTTPTGKYQLSFVAKAPETFQVQAVPQGGQVADSCGTLTVNQLGVKTPANCW